MKVLLASFEPRRDGPRPAGASFGSQPDTERQAVREPADRDPGRYERHAQHPPQPPSGRSVAQQLQRLRPWQLAVGVRQTRLAIVGVDAHPAVLQPDACRDLARDGSLCSAIHATTGVLSSWALAWRVPPSPAPLRVPVTPARRQRGGNRGSSSRWRVAAVRHRRRRRPRCVGQAHRPVAQAVGGPTLRCLVDPTTSRSTSRCRPFGLVPPTGGITEDRKHRCQV